MNNTMLENLNELKGAFENMADIDLLNDRVKLLDLIEECLEQIQE